MGLSEGLTLCVAAESAQQQRRRRQDKTISGSARDVALDATHTRPQGSERKARSVSLLDYLGSALRSSAPDVDNFSIGSWSNILGDWYLPSANPFVGTWAGLLGMKNMGPLFPIAEDKVWIDAPSRWTGGESILLSGCCYI